MSNIKARITLHSIRQKIIDLNPYGSIPVLPPKGYSTADEPQPESGSVVEKEMRYRNHFGTAMFDQLELSGDFGTFIFKTDPLIDVSYRKKVTETAVNENESVVETAGLEAVNISIKGMFWNPEQTYPEKEVKEFISVIKQNTSVDCFSYLLTTVHGIDRIFIKSVSLPALEGFEDLQPFTITARSVKSVELEILDNALE